MNHQQKIYYLFVLTNRFASLRRKVFPAGTWREKIYMACIRPIASFVLSILSRRRNGRTPAHDLDSTPKFDPMAMPTPDQIETILVIKVDHIGDFVFALPAFEALHKAFPQAKITLLCGAWNRDLAQASGLFHDIICANVYQQRMQAGTSETPHDVLVQLGQLPVYDIAIDLKHEPDTRFLLSWVKARFKAGFASPLMPNDMSLVVPTFPLVKDHPNTREVHTRTLLSILSYAVISTFSAQELTTKNVQHMAAHLESRPRPDNCPLLVGINTGSGATAKNWPLASFVLFAKRMVVEHNATIVLFGTHAEKADAAVIKAEIGNNHILDYTDAMSLSEFVSFVGKADIYIGHDTGSTHIAAALNVPTVCLYSGTGLPQRMAPSGANLIVLKNDVSCMPCGLRDIEDCSHHHQCMTGITVESVLNAVRALLQPTDIKRSS